MAELNANLGSHGVLLLCQSVETLEALSAILDQANIETIPHQGLAEAWGHLKAGVTGCVVLDAESPAADTLAFFRAARTNERTRDIPFLFLIANDFVLPQLDTFGQDITPDAWLLLPCNADQFLKQIRTMLGRKRPAPATAQQPRSLTRRFDGQSAPLPASDSNPLLGQMDTVSRSVTMSPDDLLTAPGAVFAGRLGILDVTKIVSMVEPLRLTGVLRVSDGKRSGQVHFVEGAVRHAELHDIEGADALFLLFHLKSGAFRFDLESAAGKRTIEGNTMSLLLEGLRQMDEAKALVMSFKQRRGSGSGPRPPTADESAAPSAQSGAAGL